MTAARRIAGVALAADELRAARASIMLLAAAWAAGAVGLPPGVQIPLYVACYLTGGWRPARDGFDALRQGRLDVDVLMVVAAVAAASIGEWFDGGLLIVIFATSGGLEELATARTAKGVESLLDLAPEEATRLVGGGEERVSADTLAVGDRILVRPGERVAADGTVVAGESDVDQSSITGEALPARKHPGVGVFAGSINGAGALDVEVGREPHDSVVARIVQQVREAAEAKAPTQLFIERVEQRYAVAVVAATVALLSVPLLLGHDFDDTLLRAMTFMIVASPCAVVLATMPPLLSAVATAARNGVLVRGAIAMERLAGIDAVAFDKTGTLTEGRPELASVQPTARWSADDLLAFAAAAERGSEHPVGEAVVAATRARGLPALPVEGFRSLPGRGVTAVVGGHEVRVGNLALCASDAASRAAAGAVEDDGHTPVHVEVDGAPVGVIGLADRLRHGARLVAGRLENAGIRRTVLLTGDRPAAAAPIATACGLDEVRAGLLPEDKVAAVRDLQGAGHEILVVGDGVNDAPALAAAHIGAAMGRRGTDVALETADVVLVTDVVTRLPAVITLSRHANRVVRENLVLAIGVIGVLVVPSLAGMLSLPLAVAAHEGSTLLVALNGLKLLRQSAWPAHRTCAARPSAERPSGSPGRRRAPHRTS